MIACAALDGASPEWKAGFGSTVITPRSSIWLARESASEGVTQDIHAKALALQDRAGQRFVLVTTDLLGLTAEVSGAVAARVQKKAGTGSCSTRLTHTAGP